DGASSTVDPPAAFDRRRRGGAPPCQHAAGSPHDRRASHRSHPTRSSRPNSSRSLGRHARGERDNRGLQMTVLLSVFEDAVLREYFSVTMAFLYTLMYSRFYTRIILRHHESPYGR